MATRRSLHAGGSYGRVQAVVIWALSNFDQFDAWCCIKGIDPLILPSYRFYYLALWALQEARTEEEAKDLESDLQKADKMQHPLHALVHEPVNPATGSPLKKPTKKTVVVHEDSSSRHSYVPSWWRGDQQNYKIAMKTVQTAPKEVGK